MPEQPDRRQERGLHDRDHAQHDQLRAQVGPRGQAGRPFPYVDRSFLDQFPDRADGAGQADTDDEQDQQGRGAGVGAGGPPSPLLPAIRWISAPMMTGISAVNSR